MEQQQQEAGDDDRERLELLISSHDRDGLDEFLKRFILQPRLLKDVIDYLSRIENNEWLKVEMINRPFYWLWFESYKRRFPREIVAAYEFHHFSLYPVGKEKSDRYGVIDMVLHINFSNIKGFSVDNRGIKEFLTDPSLVATSLEEQLYPKQQQQKKKNSFGEFAVLNPPIHEWREWLVFHLRMRQLAFHFLLWLIETLGRDGDSDGKKHQQLLIYGYSLKNKVWRVSSLATVRDRLSQYRETIMEDKVLFFVPLDFSLIERETAVGKLREISTWVDSQHPGENEELLLNKLFFSPDAERELEFLNDYSPEISLAFQNRCLK